MFYNVGPTIETVIKSGQSFKIPILVGAEVSKLLRQMLTLYFILDFLRIFVLNFYRCELPKVAKFRPICSLFPYEKQVLRPTYDQCDQIGRIFVPFGNL